MTPVDGIEWFAAVINVIGVGFMWYILTLLYDYRTAARQPSPQNGRRGYFAAVLLRYGRTAFLIQALLLLISVSAILRPNVTTEISLGWWLLIAISFSLDLAGASTIRDLRRIRNYASR